MSNRTFNRWALPALRPDPGHPGATVSVEDHVGWAGATEPCRPEPSTGFELGDPSAPRTLPPAYTGDPEEVDRMIPFWNAVRDAESHPSDPDARVDEASRESFPASDPPAWIAAGPDDDACEPDTEIRDDESQPSIPAP